MTTPSTAQSALPSSVPTLLQGWCELWGADGLAPEISVELSSRMTRSLGRCYPDRKLIRIARFVLEESEELFQEVLCHEAAHLAAYHLHGRSIRPHGNEWKVLMLQVGHAPAVRFKESRLEQSLPPARRRKRRPARKSFVESILDELQTVLAKHAKAAACKRRP